MNEREFLAAEPVGRMGRPEEIGWRGLAPVRSCPVCHRSLDVDRCRFCRPLKNSKVSLRCDRPELRTPLTGSCGIKETTGRYRHVVVKSVRR